MPEVSEKDAAKLEALKKSDKKFSWSASAGKVMGFSGIPGASKVNIPGPKTKKIKNEPAQVAEVKPKKPLVNDVRSAMKAGHITPEEAGNLNSRAGFKPKQSDVASALNAGHISVGEAEGLLGKKANYSKLNSYAPPYSPESTGAAKSALPAPTTGGSFSAGNSAKVNSNPSIGKQFISVDSKGSANPMVKTPYGPAVDLER